MIVIKHRDFQSRFIFILCIHFLFTVEHVTFPKDEQHYIPGGQLPPSSGAKQPHCEGQFRRHRNS